MEINFVDQPKEWERILNTFRDANFLQSYNWGEFQRALNRKVWRIVGTHGHKAGLAAQIYLEKAKRGAYFACPGGPLIDLNNRLFVNIFLTKASQLARQEGAWFLRCRPQLVNIPENKLFFSSEGFICSHMHMEAENTIQLNLDQTEEQLLAGMKKNTRYGIRRAMKNEIRVDISSKVEDVGLLYNLQMETRKRHNFVPFSLKFLTEQFKSFQKDGQALLFKAYDNDVLCAMAMVLFYRQEAVYHYAGSNLRAYGNYASYILQWKIILEAKKRGMKKYNLWGVAPNNKTNHRFSKVSMFKKGFGGQQIDYVPAMDYPFGHLYYLTRGFEFVRKKIRRL